jgi:hypothetical protein
LHLLVIDGDQQIVTANAAAIRHRGGHEIPRRHAFRNRLPQHTIVVRTPGGLRNDVQHAEAEERRNHHHGQSRA